MTVDRSSRLFFALCPDDMTRDRLDVLGKRFHEDCGGRRTAKESLHMTLVFLGATPDSRIGALHDLANGIATGPFDLILSRAGTWRGGILWLAPDALPDPLAGLVTALRQRLKAGGFFFDAKPFAPHLTLLRNARAQPAEMAIAPIRLPVQDFVLVRTVAAGQGVRHEVLQRFTLGG